MKPVMKEISKADYDVMTVKAAQTVFKHADCKELAAHIAEIATILDRMNYHAGSGWEDQAVIALMAGTRMAMWKAAGHPPLVKADAPVPANDNEPPADDMKMAA